MRYLIEVHKKAPRMLALNLADGVWMRRAFRVIRVRRGASVGGDLTGLAGAYGGKPPLRAIIGCDYLNAGGLVFWYHSS
jgi:hypothetical protein